MSTLVQANRVSRNWADRPDDSRYQSLSDLRASVAKRKSESWTAAPNVRNGIRALADDQGLGVEVFDPTSGNRRRLEPTNWGFNQLSQYAGAPAAYLRKLPDELAAINLQWGFQNSPLRDDALILAQSNGTHALRSVTSTGYGRIWDTQVIDAVEKVNTDGRWQLPTPSLARTVERGLGRTTSHYNSDRDIYIFLVDESRPVEVAGDVMYRGFVAWNSEVGAGVFGMGAFLYRAACSNRMIWTVTSVNEIRIRHTGGAPERFAHEGASYLKRYSEESATGLVEAISAAKRLELPEAKEKGGIATWLQKNGFTKAAAVASVDAAVAEEGQARSLWDIIQGVTAHARSIPFANERVDLEAKAGQLMKMVS